MGAQVWKPLLYVMPGTGVSPSVGLGCDWGVLVFRGDSTKSLGVRTQGSYILCLSLFE